MGARFGVSEGAIRKRARREGWTKRLYAAQATPWRGPASVWAGGASGVPAARPPEPARKPKADPDALTEDKVMEAWTSPLHIRPADLARRALANAAHAVKSGEGLNAVRLARAASEIARLDGLLDWADSDVAQEEERFEAHQGMMRMFLREKALSLAETLVAGGDLPPEYQDLKTELARLAAVRAAAGEGAA
ncbi:hypothetical protein [Brevundimonas lenta]|uniref:Uncharacterized protein n=1 Tax=Brevundimonas lenta TaxID=424796 RepID=A0A7W6JDK1_9CAUL|nr:hypothetical protein [Brevundimonas lenta]MBB4082186.1 hypothetical protein [Brevundimonas lenta]